VVVIEDADIGNVAALLCGKGKIICGSTNEKNPFLQTNFG
jgi:hypothetical protein